MIEKVEIFVIDLELRKVIPCKSNHDAHIYVDTTYFELTEYLDIEDKFLHNKYLFKTSIPEGIATDLNVPFT